MALNLQSLSITSVFNSIVNFFRSQENNSRWKDLTTGSEGSFLIRLLSNVFSAISYRIVAQSRENYLSTAALTSSCTGISVNLGYSVFRGSNLKRRVTLQSNRNYSFPKLSVIGTYSDLYDIIVLSDTDGTDVELQAGTPKDVNVVIGKVKEESFTPGTSAIKMFSLFTTGISEDYVLFVDGQEVPTTKVIKELKDDKYLVRSNPFGSVDIAYLNTFPNAKYTYGTGSDITIRYVELADVPVQPFSANMFSPYIDTDGLLSVTNLSNYQPYESVDSIKVNAPLDHEVQNLIRSKADYAARLQEIIPAIISSSWEALTPTYTLISYIKDDHTTLTPNQEAEVLNALKEENFFGTPLPDITVPRRGVAYLKISLALSNKYKNISDIDEDISNIIKNFYDEELGITFNTYELERKIESLSYVNYARVSHVINTREPYKNYQLGYILYHKDAATGEEDYYMASKILGTSGSSTPNWNIKVVKGIDTGELTKDGSLVWRAYKRLPSLGSDVLQKWTKETPYGIGDYVYDPNFSLDFMFKCVDLVKFSGATPPEVTYAEIGDYILDGSLVWTVKDYVDLSQEENGGFWQPLTRYGLGQSVNLTSLAGYSLECISYIGSTGTDADLVFENQYYPVESQSERTFSVVGNKTFYFRGEDIISAEYEGGADQFSVLSSSFNTSTGLTTITVGQEISSDKTYTKLFTNERGTKDGQILWTLVDDINNITYDWNTYITFEHELEIIS